MFLRPSGLLLGALWIYDLGSRWKDVEVEWNWTKAFLLAIKDNAASQEAVWDER